MSDRIVIKKMECTFKPNDKVFLFSNFQIDQELLQKLPLEIVPGVFLSTVPEYALTLAAGKHASVEENIVLAEWVYPGHSLGIEVDNICIKIDSSVPVHLQDQYFWLLIGAFYLVKPICINITGAFHYGNEDEGFLGRSPTRLGYKSNVSVDLFFSPCNGESHWQYNEVDLKQAGIYFSQLLNIFNNRKPQARPFFVLKAFFEATIWEHSVYASTIFSKLFPLIDAFAGNPTHKHDRQVAIRLSSFLSEIRGFLLNQPFCKEAIRQRIISIWHLHRGPDIHGYLKDPCFPFGDDSKNPPINKSELKDLFDLMEFARVLVIKMLNLVDGDYLDYCQIPIPRRRYDSDAEKSTEEQIRESKAKVFFEGKSFDSPANMGSFSDFLEYSDSSANPKNANLQVQEVCKGSDLLTRQS